MKKLFVITVILLIPAIVAGIWCRQTFRDCNELKDYVVAPGATSIISTASEYLEELLEETQYVLRVKCISAPQFTFRLEYQTVEIEEVFKGVGIEKGSTIAIAPCSSSIFSDDNSLNMGFVNAMQQGKEYLVFLGEKKKSRELGLEIYQTTETIVTMIFSYEDSINFPVGDVTDVPYTELQGNELFARTQEGLDIFLEIKQEVIERYQ